MAGTNNTRITFEQLYKLVYPNGVENALPDQTWWLANTPFKQIGESFKQPVKLTLPGGITFGGINDSTTAGSGDAYDLGEALASEGKKLTAQGYSITMRDVAGLGALKAARGGPESFKEALGDMFSGLQLAMSREVERSIWDGQSTSGMGVVSAVGTSGSNYTATITAATWNPSRWIGRKGHRIVFGTTGPSTWRAGLGTVVSVNYATRVITYSGDITGDAATDIIWLANYKASDGTTRIAQHTGTAWNECLGVCAAAQATGTTVWGVDNTSYDLINPQTVSAGSTDLSFDTCGTAMGSLWDKGATGTFTNFISSETFNNLISPEVALRRHDASYKPEKVKVGNGEIEFTHLTGVLKIKPYAFCKQGEAVITDPSLWTRVGASEITFEQETGDGKKKIFLTLADKNGCEIRCFSDQAPFTKRLGYTVYISNITNS
jgi:hypothetical protein